MYSVPCFEGLEKSSILVVFSPSLFPGVTEVVVRKVSDAARITSETLHWEISGKKAIKQERNNEKTTEKLHPVFVLPDKTLSLPSDTKLVVRPH